MNRWYKALCYLSALPLLVFGFIALRALVAGSGTGGDAGIILIAFFLAIAIVSTVICFGLIALTLWLAALLRGFPRSLALIIGWVLVAGIAVAAAARMAAPFFFKSML